MFLHTVPFPPASPQCTAIAGLRLRYRFASVWYLTADGFSVARVHMPGGTVTVMPDGEILGDVDAAMLELAPCAIAAAPGEHADSFVQWTADVRRAA